MIRMLLRALVLSLLALWVAPATAQVAKNVERPQTAAKPDYVSSAALRDRALGALFKAIGGDRPVSKIEIRPDAILLWVQGRGAPYHTDEWTASRLKILVLDRDNISGPRATDGDGIVKKREGSFFAMDEVALDSIEAFVAEAVGMAGMEQMPGVTSLTIARRIGILPEPHYGDVLMTLNLATEREQATVYGSADGLVIGADLAGTERASRLDLIADDDWPMAEAQRRIAAAIGSKGIHELRIYSSYVFFQAEHPSKDDTTRDYSWDLGGVSMGMELEDYFASMRDTQPFHMDEIDLTRLPEVKKAALAAFDSPGAVITYIDADKPTDRPSSPQVLWAVDLKQTDGEQGKVLLDAKANVIEVRLPESRIAAAQGPWLAPETVAATLARIGREFGTDARFGEILIDDSKASVLVEDPQAPGTMANFIVDAQSATRFGTPMPWEAELDTSRAFTIAELTSLDAATIGALERRTLERMELPGAAVFRYTISKQMLMMSPEDSRLLVEIRAGKNDGWVSGWVTYDLAGAEADVMMP